MRGWHPHPLMRIAPVVAVMFVAAVIISGAPWLLFMLFWFWAFAGAGPRRARARWRQQQMVGPAGSWRPARRQDWAS
jgi:uncharacterized protein (DUF2062 family)